MSYDLSSSQATSLVSASVRSTSRTLRRCCVTHAFTDFFRIINRGEGKYCMRSDRVVPQINIPHDFVQLIHFLFCSFLSYFSRIAVCKGKAVPLQAWSGSEGSRKLRFPDFMTTAQDGGKVVSFSHRPPLPTGNAPSRTHFCQRLSRPQGHSAIGRILDISVILNLYYIMSYSDQENLDAILLDL